MMLCPLNVVLKLNRFVNVSCSFNIRGEYFKARYFSIPLACCFFTNQWTGFFVPLHTLESSLRSYPLPIIPFMSLTERGHVDYVN